MKVMSLFLPILFIISFFGFHQNTDTSSKRDKRTPFDKVIYIDQKPFISVNNEWVELHSIVNIPIADYVEMAKEISPKEWEKGFHRYLHYIMDEFKIVRGDSIDVTYIKDDQTITVPFSLHRKNRDLSVQFHDSIVKTNRIERSHYKTTPESFNYLTTRIDGYNVKVDTWLTSEEAIHDLEYLEWEIKNNYSYINLTGFDYQSALDAIRNDLQQGISIQDFALQLKMLMANFGDGHSRVSISKILKGRSIKWAPFKIKKHDDKFYAIDLMLPKFLHDKYPYLAKINDINIEHYYELAKNLVPKSTPKYIERKSISYLSFLQLILKMDGQNTDSLKVTFANDESEISEVIHLGKPEFKKTKESHILKDTILENNIGYIAMTYEMAGRRTFADSIHTAMKNIKRTDGLVIDIRGNGGGRRLPLLEFLPYFIAETKIVNAARFRVDGNLNIHSSRGFLDGRHCYPAYISKEDYFDETHKNYAEFIAAVNLFKEKFRPSYVVSDEKFSPLHYMAVHPHSPEDKFYYDKPVIVLIDEGCFSASDIFAAGIREGDNVRLLGNTTGGGSGYTKSKHLPNSDISVKLSRMVSYQPDGNLYDGHGVVPDIKSAYTLEDRMGKSDSMLDKALEVLRGINKD